MKGFFIKLIVLIILVVGVANYLVFRKTGRLPMNNWITVAQNDGVGVAFNVAWKEIVSSGKALNQIVDEHMPAEKPSAPVKISKWTDAKGVVHYENRPVNGAQSIEVDPNANVLPPAPVVELPQEKPKEKTMDQEMQELRDAKRAKIESLIQ